MDVGGAGRKRSGSFKQFRMVIEKGVFKAQREWVLRMSVRSLAISGLLFEMLFGCPKWVTYALSLKLCHFSHREKIMIRNKYLFAASILMTTAAQAVEMPQELLGIYSTDKASCQSDLAEYKKSKDNFPYLMIEKAGATWYRARCTSTKVTGGNGVYKTTEVCLDEDGKSKLNATYKIDGNNLTHTVNARSSSLLKCSGPL